MSPISKSLIQVNIAVFLLGGTTLFAKLVSLPAHTITLYRAIFGFVGLALYIKMTGSAYRLANRHEYFLAAAAGFLVGLHWVTFFHAIQISSVAVGIISLYTFPVITALLEPLFDNRRIQPAHFIQAMVVFAGILLIAPEFKSGNPIFAGALWGVVSAGLFALRNILVRKKMSHIPGSVAMAYQLLAMCFLLAPFVPVHVGLMSDNRLILLIVLGLLFTAVPHALLVVSLRHLSATTVSLIACLHPLYSIVFALVILTEIPSLRILIGGAIIIATAVYESIWVGRRERKPT